MDDFIDIGDDDHDYTKKDVDNVYGFFFEAAIRIFFFSDLRNTFLDVMVDTRRLILIENQVVVSVITDLV